MGEIFINGVRPKKNPNRYAIMSLMITSEVGSTNQMRASKMFATKHVLWG